MTASADKTTAAGLEGRSRPTPRGRRLVSLGCAAALAAATVASAGGPAPAACPDDIAPGVAAKSVRTLQSDMMVAALSCQQARGLYNSFVTDYRSELQRHGRMLKTRFKSEYGGAATKKLNNYVTRLANDAAIRYAEGGAAYCEAARETLATLLESKAETPDLGVYAVRYAVDVKPALARDIAATAGSGDGCDADEAVALNLPE